jgi:ribonuclease P protein component
MKAFSFPKGERLLNRKDFVNLNRSGMRYRTEHFTALYKENGLKQTRLGITVSKRVGNAVKRNRIKRLVREFFRQNKESFLNGYDVNFIADKNAWHLVFKDIEKEMGNFIFVKKNNI